MSHLYAIGLGVGTQNTKGEWLEVYFPQPWLNPQTASVQPALDAIGYEGGNACHKLDSAQLGAMAQMANETGHWASQLADSKRPVVLVVLGGDEAPANVPEAYLKLHLLSHRLVKPHGTKLDGLFGVLKNVAWTNKGAIDLDELPAAQLQARMRGEPLSVNCIDKFPKMVDYVVPAGVRIADTARVRLGAYIGEGTTIMHEGFVNFNAGTLGKGMIEGRISAGVVVGEGSDLGGGCSIMGTLSGGGTLVIGVGKECLIGANAGLGIPLGDRCTIEAGLYVTAGTKLQVLDDNNQPVKQVKARELAGRSDLLFRRNSLTGVVECKTNRAAVALNDELHAHN